MDRAAFDGHPIWATIENLEQALRSSEGKAGPPSAPYVARLRAVIGYARSFKAAGHEYFNQSMLDGAYNSFVNAQNHIGNWTSNPNNADYLRQVADYVDQALPVIGSWPAPPARGGAARQAREMFEAYQQSAEATIEALREQVANLQQRLVQEKAEYDERATEAEAALEQLKGRIAEQEARIADGGDQLEAQLAAKNEAFNEEQDERAQKYNDWLEGQGGELEQRVRPFVSQLEEQVDWGEQQVAKIDKLYKDSENLAGKAAASILGGDYGSYALREWIAALVAYGVGFAILGSVGYLLFNTISRISLNVAISWQYVALKLGLTLTAAAAATVAFQLGSKLINRSHAGKRAALELKAIGPFLADVDDPELVRKAKISFVERMFGRAWDLESVSESPGNNDGATIVGTLDKVLEIAQAVGQKAAKS